MRHEAGFLLFGQILVVVGVYSNEVTVICSGWSYCFQVASQAKLNGMEEDLQAINGDTFNSVPATPYLAPALHSSLFLQIEDAKTTAGIANVLLLLCF
jgi:hypothetical protein